MLRKKSKQKFTEKSVEDMNDLDLTSIFSSLLKDKKNVTV